MTKVKQYALLASLLIAFLKTLLLSPPAPSDIAALAVIGTIFAYLEYKNKDKDLENLAIAVKKQEVELTEIKDKLSRINITQQFKPGALNFK